MILLDTSGLLSALFADQRHHRECLRVLEERRERLVLSPFVLAELDYLISKLAGADSALKLLEEVARGAYELAAFSQHDVGEAAKLMERHRDLAPGLADASIVVLARRFRCLDVLTLDERHFRLLAGPKGQPFRLLPGDA